MKNEKCGVPIKRFVRLKSKMYIYLTEDDHESDKAKAINKNIVTDKLKYEERYFVL